MFCPRQGPGGGGHKGWLSGLGASRSCSDSLAPFLLLRLPVLAVAGTGEQRPSETPATHTHKNRQQKQTNRSYKAPLALPQTSHGATPLPSPGGNPAGEIWDCQWPVRAIGDQWEPWAAPTGHAAPLAHWMPPKEPGLSLGLRSSCLRAELSWGYVKKTIGRPFLPIRCFERVAHLSQGSWAL